VRAAEVGPAPLPPPVDTQPPISAVFARRAGGSSGTVGACFAVGNASSAGPADAQQARFAAAPPGAPSDVAVPPAPPHAAPPPPGPPPPRGGRPAAQLGRRPRRRRRRLCPYHQLHRRRR